MANWAGWLMVSASKATSCRVRASSKMRSVSLWTSAAGAGRRRGSGGWHGGDGQAHGGCGGDCREMRRGERDGDRTRRGLILGLGRSDVTPAPGTGGVRCRREVAVGSQLWHRLGEEGAKPPRTTRIWGGGSDGGCVTGVSPNPQTLPSWPDTPASQSLVTARQGGRGSKGTCPPLPPPPPGRGLPGVPSGPNYIPKTSVSGAGKEGSSAEGRKPKGKEEKERKTQQREDKREGAGERPSQTDRRGGGAQGPRSPPR